MAPSKIVKGTIAYVKKLASDLKQKKEKREEEKLRKKEEGEKETEEKSKVEVKKTEEAKSGEEVEKEGEEDKGEEKDKDEYEYVLDEEEEEETMIDCCNHFLKHFEKILHEKPPQVAHVFSVLRSDAEDSNMALYFFNKCSIGTCHSLPFMGLQGLFSLVNKSDCDGAYSHGESADICELLEKVKPFLFENDDFFGDGFYVRIFAVFEESNRAKKMVRIH